jgi:hypothetical protein
MGSQSKWVTLLLIISVVTSSLTMFMVDANTQTTSTPNLEWTKTYSRNSVTARDEGLVVTRTSDGGYAIIGSLVDNRFAPQTNEVDNASVVFIKTDSLGNIQWEKTNLPFSIYPYCFILQTKDLGFLVSGYPISGDNVIKLDSEGNIQWKKNYGCEVGYVTQTSDGNYVFLGSIPTSALAGIGCLLKIDSQGNLLWNTTLHIPTDLLVSSVLEISNSTFAVCGHYIGDTAWFGEINSNGDLIINQTYPEFSGYFSSMVRSEQGNFIAVGGIGTYNDKQGLIADIDPTGKLVWSQEFMNPPYGSFAFSSIAGIGNGYFVAAGRTGLVCYDIEGNLLWNVSGDAVGGSVSAITSSNPGSFVVVGSTASSIWLAKYSFQTNASLSSTPKPNDLSYSQPFFIGILLTAFLVIISIAVILFRRHPKKTSTCQN